MAYDRTSVDVLSKLLLLNIARAHRDDPIHFTGISSIAATYDFRFSAGIGPANTGELGWLPMPFVGGSTAENPTITITPMQGDEFTKRLLTPFDEQKITMLLRQGYDVDALLRLVVEELRVSDGDNEVVSYNRPSDKLGYERFRKVMAHLSSVQDRHVLHVDPLAIEGGRVVISNYDPRYLSRPELDALLEETTRAGANDVVIDIRADKPGGELPMHGTLRLRSFLNVLTFVARGISAEPEVHVDPDPRTPTINENPVSTLEIVVNPTSKAELSVKLAEQNYAVKAQTGYQWNKKAFSLLYQLFQMSVTATPNNGPSITIAK